jgi:esterase/lipase
LKRIYAIPGLGTTKELFRFLNIPGTELIVLEWPDPKPNDTMENYAEAFSKQIDTSAPFYLLGVSFGGMICVELNESFPAEKLFLVSSCKSRKELPLLLRLLKYFPLHKMVGEKNLRCINAISRKMIGFEKSLLPQFMHMMNSMTPNYYTYSVSIIVKWKRLFFSANNIIHIHGTADKLLPIRYVKPNHVIKNGTHAMIVNNAHEIAGIIQTYL